MKANKAVGDDGQLLSHRLQLALDLLDAGLDVVDLVTGLGEERPQGVGKLGVGILYEDPDRRDHLTGPHRDEDPQLAQEASECVQARGSLRHPPGAEAMKRGEHLLGHRLDGNRVDILVAAGFQMPLASVRSVLLRRT
jgi:hypothetical protein